MGVPPACVDTRQVQTQYCRVQRGKQIPQNPRPGPGLELQLSGRCWELSPSPLEGPLLLLFAKPSPAPHVGVFWGFLFVSFVFPFFFFLRQEKPAWLCLASDLLCRSGWPRTRRDPRASASASAEIKVVCTASAFHMGFFFFLTYRLPILYVYVFLVFLRQGSHVAQAGP